MESVILFVYAMPYACRPPETLPLMLHATDDLPAESTSNNSIIMIPTLQNFQLFQHKLNCSL